VANWDDVRALALALPETGERRSRDGWAMWRVREKLFVWERPLRRADLAALGDRAPAGPILAARVPDAMAKEALIRSDPDVYFTIPHFDGYLAVLALLERIPHDELRELVVEAWLLRAPKRVASAYAQAGGLAR
jgi:hypothetical protein